MLLAPFLAQLLFARPAFVRRAVAILAIVGVGALLSLLDNPALGEPILQMGDVISEDELRNFAREIGADGYRRRQRGARNS